MISKYSFAVVQGLRDVRLVAGRALVLMVQSTLLAILLVFATGQALATVQDIRQASRLAEADLIYHLPIYEAPTPLNPSDELRASVEKILSVTRSAYSFQKSPEFAPGGGSAGPTLAVFGDFADVFDIGTPEGEPPYAVLGAQRTDLAIGDTVVWDSRTVPIVGKLPPNSSFLDQWDGETRLDNYLVLFGDSEAVASSTIGFEEIALRIVMPHDAVDARAEYLGLMTESEAVSAIPRAFSVKISTDYQRAMSGDLFFLSVFAAAFAGGVLYTGIGSLSLLQKRRRDLIATTFLGAGRIDLVLRLGVFVSVSWLLPSLAGLSIAGALSLEPMPLVVAVVFPIFCVIVSLLLTIAGSKWIQKGIGMSVKELDE